MRRQKSYPLGDREKRDMHIAKHGHPLTPPLGLLLQESVAEGFRFLSRLVTDWESGVNRFARSDEVVFLAFIDDDVVGIGGLNVDPYASSDSIGRVRHVYVSPIHRRRGIGRALMQQVLNAARGKFRLVRLRTDTREGDCFYRSLGFKSYVNPQDATHYLEM